MSAECPECGNPRIWGGMGWDPHDERVHRQARVWSMRRIQQAFAESLAERSGHKVTIKFAGRMAWFECSCGATGQVFEATSYARLEARIGHLMPIGNDIIRRNA